jgi:hypothetical protein
LEVLGYFNFLIEGDRLGLVINLGLDETFSVTFIEEFLHFGEGAIESHERLEGSHLHVFEVVLTFLKDSD